MSKETKEITDERSHGQKIRDTLIKKYGEDYYSKLGKVGGKKSDNRPFRDNPGAAKKAIDKRWAEYYKTHPRPKATVVE